MVSFTSPVPESDTYVMLLAGLGLLGFVARRKKKHLIRDLICSKKPCLRDGGSADTKVYEAGLTMIYMFGIRVMKNDKVVAGLFNIL